MAFDGITISAIVAELKSKALGGRIDKVYQPEKDELILNIRSLGSNLKFLITASSSHPRLHFTSRSKENPMQAPLFCMVMRKHFSGSKILKVEQVGFERIVKISVESNNELGDLVEKSIIIEIMGKHSNIILCDENNKILDSVKRISHEISSVREVLPGRMYVLPPKGDKLNPLELNEKEFFERLNSSVLKIQDFLYKTYTGISPSISSELCFRANLDTDSICKDILNKKEVFNVFFDLMEKIKREEYKLEIIYNKEKLTDFSCVEMLSFKDFKKKSFESPSEMCEYFYGEKDLIYRTKQKTSDLKKIIDNNIERCFKKREMYVKTFNEIKDRDVLKVFGELLTANIYEVKKGMTSFSTNNFYSANSEEITIQLDPELTPSENAQKYFKKYNKEKRTYIALKEQMTQNDEEKKYLESISAALLSCTEEVDIEELKEELAEAGFIKKPKNKKGSKPKKSKPIHFISSDGYDIYVGKNNKQNDELTLKFAESFDYWFHTKDIPGSHVIVKAKPLIDIPKKTLNEAVNLAAYYSKGREGSHISVDYTIRKNVKKPNGAKPGMVIYDNYNTAVVTPDESIIRELSK